MGGWLGAECIHVMYGWILLLSTRNHHNTVNGYGPIHSPRQKSKFKNKTKKLQNLPQVGLMKRKFTPCEGSIAAPTLRSLTCLSCQFLFFHSVQLRKWTSPFYTYRKKKEWPTCWVPPLWGKVITSSLETTWRRLKTASKLTHSTADALGWSSQIEGRSEIQKETWFKWYFKDHCTKFAFFFFSGSSFALR